MAQGFLVFHYTSRDVHIPADGDSGIRTVDHYRAHLTGGDLDELKPGQPLAHLGWISMSTEGLLGVSWQPDLPIADRITVDPAGPDAWAVEQRMHDAIAAGGLVIL